MPHVGREDDEAPGLGAHQQGRGRRAPCVEGARPAAKLEPALAARVFDLIDYSPEIDVVDGAPPAIAMNVGLLVAARLELDPPTLEPNPLGSP